MKKDNDRDYKKEIIDSVVSDLQKRAVQIHENPDLPATAQLTQMDVIWNLIKVLGHYSENMQVLEAYRLKKQERKRLMQDKEKAE